MHNFRIKIYVLFFPKLDFPFSRANIKRLVIAEWFIDLYLYTQNEFNALMLQINLLKLMKIIATLQNTRVIGLFHSNI